MALCRIDSTACTDAITLPIDGHYLNLPVVDEVGALIGIVDVLKLTYATLEQVNTLHADAGGAADPAGGPLWGRFFSAAAEAGGVDDDVESVLSGLNGSEAASSQAPFHTPSRPGYHRSKDSIDTPGSELFPGDSASVVNADDASDVGVSHRGGPHASSVGGISQPATTIVDDGTYLFKFVAPGGTTHRFQARYDSHEFLIDIVSGKLASDPFFASSDASPSPSTEAVEATDVVAQEVKPDPKDFQVSYRDDDGDLVLMTADRDVTDAVQTAKQQGKDRVVLHVSGGSTWKQAIAAAAERDEKEREKAKAATVTKKLVVVEEEAADVEAGEETDAAEPVRNAAGTREGKKARKAAPAAPADDLVAGILPKEYLLPASIGFLGVVIATVFIASRAGASAK